MPPALLTLHAGDHEASSALMPVSWCAEPGLADGLLAANVRDPRLLLVTQYLATDHDFGYKEEYWRDASYQVVPLKAGFAHVAFRRPGPNRVTAVVVDVASPDSRRALRRLVRKGRGLVGYDPDDQVIRWVRGADSTSTHPQAHPFFNRNAHWSLQDVRRPKDGAVPPASVTVQVDPALFAAPVSPRRLWVASRVFGATTFADECRARSRTLVWGPVLLPFVLLFADLAKLVTLPLVVLFGVRRPPFRQLANPVNKFFDDVLGADSSDPRVDMSSRWWRARRAPGLPNTVTPPFRFDAPFSFVNVALSPPVLVLAPLLVFGFVNLPWRAHDHGPDTKLWTASFLRVAVTTDVAVVLALVAAAAVGVAIVGVIVGLVGFVQFCTGEFHHTPKTLWRQALHPFRRDPAASQAHLRRQVLLATCDDDGPATSVTDLSLQQLTPRLLFNAAKAAVCKPFAE